MAGLYGDYDDAALIAKIREIRDASMALAGGEMVAKVQGEGRMMEFVRSNASGLDLMMRNLMAEARRRGLDIADGYGGAIAVEIG